MTISDGEGQMVTGGGICAEECQIVTKKRLISHMYTVQGSLSTLMVLDRYGHLRRQEYKDYPRRKISLKSDKHTTISIQCPIQSLYYKL